MNEALDNLLRHTGIWRASAGDSGIKPGLPSDYPELDRHLPGGGWPRDGVTELLHDYQGMGELRVITPALARLSREEARWIAWIAPPHLPYAPALATGHIDLIRVLIVTPRHPREILWTAEKVLSSQSCSAVLLWPGTIEEREIRRLQLAAREGSCWNVLFRPGSAARQSSPAELRVQLHPHPLSHNDNSILEARILKRRGGWATDFFQVDLRDRLHRQTPPPCELILPGRSAVPGSRQAAVRGFSGLPVGMEKWIPDPSHPGASKQPFTGQGDDTIQWH